MNFLHDLPEAMVVDREKFILNEVIGKSVLHLGAVDLNDSSICSFHQKLSSKTKNVIGLDNDIEGIKKAKSLGINNIFYYDVEMIGDGTDFPFEIDFDIILATEIIEHLFNPGLFLNSIKKFFSRDTKMIITTPNAFAFHRTLFNTILHKEYVHPDHTYYYTYTTLDNIIKRITIKLTIFITIIWAVVSRKLYANLYLHSLRE